MKKVFTGVMIVPLLFVMIVPSYASDWDKAGKILTAIEGLRIFSRGEIDIIGNMTGIDKEQHYVHKRKHRNKRKSAKHHRRRKYYAKNLNCYHDIWVPQYEWRRKYIPEHETYDPDLGRIIVEGHYIKYKVESGGYFKTSYVCR
ncbi:MAG: hypothetical protein K8S27_00120 [Candidatus Omnitrophica bacterium]|nr:hypothetical protein [Candidatus Omnitrophota bacterium]